MQNFVQWRLFQSPLITSCIHNQVGRELGILFYFGGATWTGRRLRNFSFSYSTLARQSQAARRMNRSTTIMYNQHISLHGLSNRANQTTSTGGMNSTQFDLPVDIFPLTLFCLPPVYFFFPLALFSCWVFFLSIRILVGSLIKGRADRGVLSRRLVRVSCATVILYMLCCQGGKYYSHEIKMYCITTTYLQ